MAKYEMAIAVADEADLKSGHKRKKEGDIIDIAPSPHDWGLKEIDEHLIVLCELDEDWRLLKYIFVSLRGSTGEKRRFRILLNDLKTNYCAELDLVKVQDKKIIYQPFKKESDILNKLDLQSKDVDCGLVAENEIVISKGENFIYDIDNSAYIWAKDLIKITVPEV